MPVRTRRWPRRALVVAAPCLLWVVAVVVAGAVGWSETGRVGLASWRAGFDRFPVPLRSTVGLATVPVCLASLLALGSRWAKPRGSSEPADAEPTDPGPRSAGWRVPALAAAGVLLLATTYGVVQVRFNHYVADLGTDQPVRQVAPDVIGDLVSGLTQFDGPEYAAIARTGYERRQLVWFPLYPMMMRIGGDDPNSPEFAGVLVSLVSGAVAAAALARWTALRQGTPARQVLTVAAMVAYPYSWFLLGVVYADALFTALAIGAFIAVERDRLGRAAILAALATATRPSGFAVAIGITVLAAERHGLLVRVPRSERTGRRFRPPVVLRRDRWEPRFAVLLVAWGGLAAFMAYQWAAFGSPVRFLTEQANYHDPGLASLMKWQYFAAWSQPEFDGRHLATTTAQLVLLCLAVASVPAVGKRYGWGYAAYVLCLAALPAWSVSTFMGVGRYLLPAFPCFALVGEHIAQRPARRIALLVPGFAAMAVMAIGFSRSWYLS